MVSTSGMGAGHTADAYRRSSSRALYVGAIGQSTNERRILECRADVAAEAGRASQQRANDLGQSDFELDEIATGRIETLNRSQSSLRARRA